MHTEICEAAGAVGWRAREGTLRLTGGQSARRPSPEPPEPVPPDPPQPPGLPPPEPERMGERAD
jgi:hypothetical protein